MTTDKNAKKLTAAQRIEGLEDAVLQINDRSTHNAKFLANSIDLLKKEIEELRQSSYELKQTLRALAKRLNATIQAGEQGQMKGEMIDNLLVEESINELKAQVSFLQENGVLLRSESGEIEERSFVVGRELDEEKNVINGRIQFAVTAIVEDARHSVMGKKAGESVTNADGTTLEILEVYSIAEGVEKNPNAVTQD
mgnify:CR=1 FL=1